MWLKLATSEVEEAAMKLEHGDLPAAVGLLRRAVLSIKFIIDQIEMLDQMSPWEYQSIQVVLGHGSGFDSPEFRRVPKATQGCGARSRVGSSGRRRAGLELTERYQRGREFEDLYHVTELLTEWDERI